jgi:hypothetical protein
MTALSARLSERSRPTPKEDIPTMKKMLMVRAAVILVVAGLTVLPWLVGCGGGSSLSQTAAGSGTGSLTLSVDFPASRAANLPPEVQTVRVAVSGIGLAVALTAVLTPDSDTATFADVPVGMKQVLATGHVSTADDTILAGGFNEVEIVEDADANTAGVQAASVDLVMGPPAHVTDLTVTGTKDIGGVPATVMQASMGQDEMYFLRDDTGLRQLGELVASDSVAATLVTREERYSPALLLVPFGVAAGHTSQQTVNVLVDGLLKAQIASTVKFVGFESLTLPLGTFRTARVEIVQQVTPVGGSGQTGGTDRRIFWLAAGVGPVAVFEDDETTMDGDGLPRLSVLTGTTFPLPTAGSSTSGLLTPEYFPLNTGAGLTFVDLLKREPGSVVVTG